MRDIQALMKRFHNDPLGLLQKLGGCYLRPPGGPLVGYAGTYDDEAGVPKNYVGELYANFAMAEQWPSVMDMWARYLCFKDARAINDVNVFLGAPEGGKALADKLAMCNSRQYVYPDTKETPVIGGRPKKEFVWGCHKLEEGQKVAIVEDVANNFSTTEKLIQLVLDAGCDPVVLICLLNRSPNVDDLFEWSAVGAVRVVSFVRKPMPEYRQDDVYVADDIVNDNIVWKPRKTPEDWQRLMQAMAASSQ